MKEKICFRSISRKLLFANCENILRVIKKEKKKNENKNILKTRQYLFLISGNRANFTN